MTSDQFETRLNELLDRRIAPEADPEVLRIAEQYTECRSLLGAYRAVVDGVVETDPPRPPADLADRVMKQWRREKVGNRCLVAQRRVVTGVANRRALCATAAALLIAGPGLGWLWHQVGDIQPLATLPAQPPAAIAELASNRVAPAPIAAALNTAAPNTDATTDVSTNAAAASNPKPVGTASRAMGEMASLLGPGQRPSPAGDRPSASVPGATPPAAEGAAWVGEVSQGFQPIAESAAGALDFLLEVLADGSDGSRG
jgi:hypothetical protein